MKIVLDTNVFVSGVFFRGFPFQILKAWRDGRVQLVISPEILEEYYRVGEFLAERFPGVDLETILELLALNSELAPPLSLPEPVCDDPDDDKFLSCAIASGTKYVISGDKHLLKVSGYHGLEIMSPRNFVINYLGTLGRYL